MQKEKVEIIPKKTIMKDILGRDLKEGDIVVVKSNGSYNPDTVNKGMEVGVIYKKSVKTLSTLKSSRKPKDIFLVENPSEKELDIKKSIETMLDLNKQLNQKHKKDLELKGNKIGGIYLDAHEKPFMYLGHFSVETLKNKMHTGIFRTGHFYVKVGEYNKKYNFNSLNDIIDNVRFKSGNIINFFNYPIITKNTKQFHQFLGINSDFDSISKVTNFDYKQTICKTNVTTKVKTIDEITYEIIPI